MDLDDSFCERIIKKTQARREYISNKKRAALEEFQVNSDDPPEESPKRQCTEAVQSQYATEDKENFGTEDEDSSTGFVPYPSVSKNRGLAALKRNFHNDADADLETTPIHQVNKRNTYVYSTNSSELCVKQKPSSRLANLAANIRQWEDDSTKPTLSSKNVTSNTKPQIFSTNTPNPASETNSISMKLYYSSRTPLKAGDSEIHKEKYSFDSTPHSSLSKKCSVDISACEKGNIKHGSVAVGVKSKKLQVWDEAVMAALEPSSDTQIDYTTSVTDSSNEDTQQTSTLDQEYDDEEFSDTESIDRNDFAENYNDFKLDDPSKMEVDDCTTQQADGLKKLTEKKNIGRLTGLDSAGAEKLFNANVDPSELPLSARKALFEKALLSGSPKINDNVAVHTLSVTQRAAMFENASKSNTGAKNVHLREAKRIVTPDIFSLEKKSDVVKSPVKVKQPIVKSDSQENKVSPMKKPPSVAAPSTPSPSKNVGNHTRFMQQKLIESSGSNWQEKQTAKAVAERKQEISSLVNHWEKISSSSSTENNSEMQKVSLASDENFSYKSEKEESPQEPLFEEDSKCGDINNEDISERQVDLDNDYSSDDNDYDNEENDCTDDVEDKIYSHENEEINENENVFYSQKEAENLKPVEKNYENKQQHDSASTSSHNNKSVMSCISYSDILACTGDSPIFSSQSLNSDSSSKSQDTSDKKEKNPEINLLRTVSAYRREKQELKITPVRKIVLSDKSSSPESPPDADYTEMIQQRLKDLQEEILRQQTVISQTSQALNLCSATTEFSGSIEQVEGERLLLIATQKRQACLNEITRMKTCGAQGMRIDDGTGTLTVTDLQLPLKREFIASQLEGRDNDFVHYFLCLIRHGAQVIVTQMMSTDDKTSDGTLSFSNLIKLTNLPADFSVVFEVYALQTKKDVLPHDKKYHIKRVPKRFLNCCACCISKSSNLLVTYPETEENSKRRLTPKSKKNDNKIPAISSPGGPSAVRSPSFGIVGYTRFTIHNCNKKTFTLDKVPFTSPLEGVLRVKLQLHAEHKVTLKGFLTFYEDVNNLGALYRRWCVLDGNSIAYWRYPEDVYKKDPVGVIDLRQCITDLVKSVSSIECARPHTFKLMTMRPQQKGDKNTLVSRTANTITTTKHLLTADTKDERILWCNKINEALTNLRKWDPEAQQPLQQAVEI